MAASDMNEEREKVTILSAKDLDISYYCGSGAGGQKRNKTASGVQMIHRESGAIGRNSETRSQHQNKIKAFESMIKTPKFKFWLVAKLFEIQQHQTIEEYVAKSMTSKNLKMEIREGDKWVEVEEEYFNGEKAKKEV